MTAPITVPAPPPLVNIHNVELIHTGQWNISTGTWTATREDLEAAVAALDCPAIRNPVIKIGHTDPRFDGEPAVGWLGNLTTQRDGNTLTCSYMGVPGWLAATDGNGNSVLTSAYPDRSIEGVHDFRCQVGHTHPFVLTGVALLGVTPPGVGTLQSLQDIAALYGVAAAAPESGVRIRATVHGQPEPVAAAVQAHTGAMVALVPTDADAQRLAVDVGEPVGELHTTLMYLGDAADWNDDDRQAVIDAATQIAAGRPPVEADGFGLSIFNPAGDEPCIVLTLGGSALDDVHTATLAAVTSDGVPEQRSPWIPHVTLAYTDDAALLADLVDRTGPITFDRLRVAFAGETTDIPLAAPTQAGIGPGGRSIMPNPKPTQVAAGVTTEDVRRQYYDDAPWSYWITEFHLEPLQLIVVDDDSGKHYRVPVTVTGEDTFTFGDPVEVLVRYMDAPAGTAQVAASAPIVYASRAESRPGRPPRAASETPPGAPPQPPPDGTPDTATPQTPPDPGGVPVSPAAEPDQPSTEIEEDPVSTPSEIRSRLGLPEDADDAAVLAALDTRLTPATAPTPPDDDEVDVDEPTPADDRQLVAATSRPKLPDGVVAVEASVLDELRRNATLGAQAAERQRVEDRDRHIEAAVAAGKFSPARRDHWVKAWEADPEGVKATIDSLEEGLVVPTVAAGRTGSPDETIADANALTTNEIDAWAKQLGIPAEELTRG